MKNKPYKIVKFPHISSTINFYDMSKLKGIKIVGSGFTCLNDKNEICIFIENIAESVKKIEYTPTIAHELLHALQILMKRMNTKMEDESESSAYMLTYAMCTLMDLPYYEENELRF